MTGVEQERYLHLRSWLVDELVDHTPVSGSVEVTVEQYLLLGMSGQRTRILDWAGDVRWIVPLDGRR